MCQERCRFADCGPDGFTQCPALCDKEDGHGKNLIDDLEGEEVIDECGEEVIDEGDSACRCFEHDRTFVEKPRDTPGELCRRVEGTEARYPRPRAL